MSLYRKYRPKIFADVYGQEHVVQTLENAAKNEKLAHAYVFAGTRGTGKTSVARIVAKLLMCRGIEDATIKKQIEEGVDSGSIVDLLEIDAASNRGIDDIRDIIEKIQFSPVVASAKVYIIDEVHMLTKEAFNALLKTLEEPPAYAYFILATTELNKIPVTVQSRCQCFPFRQIRDEDIIRRLQYIADQEHIHIDRDALRSIAHLSEGGMRDAISLLDQLRSVEHITQQEVEKHTGASGQEYVADLFEALNQQNRDALLESIAKIEHAGVPLDIFTRQLLRIVREAIHTSIKEKQATDSLLGLQSALLEAIANMRISPVPALVLEAALLSLCNESGVAQRGSSLVTVALAKETDPQPLPSTDAESIIQAPELSLETMQKSWSNILEHTKPASVKMSLKNGRITQVNGSKVIVAFSSAFHRDTVRDTEASRAVEEVMENIFKTQLTLECELENNAHDHETPQVTPSQEDVVNLADAAAEIF